MTETIYGDGEKGVKTPLPPRWERRTLGGSCVGRKTPDREEGRNLGKVVLGVAGTRGEVSGLLLVGDEKELCQPCFIPSFPQLSCSEPRLEFFGDHALGIPLSGVVKWSAMF